MCGSFKRKKSYKLIIIGGGAAGLFAASYAVVKRLGLAGDILLLEKMPRPGRKINITGKGRCNLTNTRMWDEFAPHVHPNSNFLKNAFYNFTTHDTMAFFEEAGLPLTVEAGQRVFPKSLRAMDVTDVLVNTLSRAGVGMLTDCTVEKVTSNEQDSSFTVSSSKGEFCSDYILIATGGLSYPSTGSTGDGYKFAQSLGHSIRPTLPSLTALTPVNYSVRLLQGLHLKNIAAALEVNGNIVQEEFGELDFTNGGIEGSVGFRLSRKAVEAMSNSQKTAVVIDLKPSLSVSQLQERIKRETATGGKGVKFLLHRLLPVQLVKPFMAMTPDLTVENMPQRLKSWRFVIGGYVGYERCVVTNGGVSIKEVSQKTMESKLCKGLFFAGEVLDIDGDTGGYNLQIAFSTAALAIDTILNN